jgi:hypothetical protein
MIILDIELKKGIDPCDISERLNKYTNIQSNTIGCNRILVKHNDDGIASKKVVKLIAAISNPDKRTRKKAIISIKEVHINQNNYDKTIPARA